MILIDGKKEAAELREKLKQEVLELKSKYNKVPGLTVILIGELAPSKIYVKNKEKSGFWWFPLVFLWFPLVFLWFSFGFSLFY